MVFFCFACSGEEKQKAGESLAQSLGFLRELCTEQVWLKNRATPKWAALSVLNENLLTKPGDAFWGGLILTHTQMCVSSFRDLLKTVVFLLVSL